MPEKAPKRKPEIPQPRPDIVHPVGSNVSDWGTNSVLYQQLPEPDIPSNSELDPLDSSNP